MKLTNRIRRDIDANHIHVPQHDPNQERTKELLQLAMGFNRSMSGTVRTMGWCHCAICGEWFHYRMTQEPDGRPSDEAK